MTTSKWVTFFRDSGLPSEVAVNYAIIFADNRIQKGMLLDLTKEYLFDMGIHVMGDVIAILKHAKQVHSQEAQAKAMKSDKSSPSSNAASRILSRYTRRVEQPSPSLPYRSTFEDVGRNEPARPAKRHAVDNGDVRFKQPALQRIQPAERRLPAQQYNVQESVPRYSVSLPKSQPVVQPAMMEQEEGPTLKVVLPAGKTARSRQILERAYGPGGTASSTKRSVFDRLGESAVSSTTDVTTHAKQQQSTVFQRLGPSTDACGSEPSDDALPYRGVLKAPAKANPQPTGKVIRLTKAPTSTPARTLTVRKSAIQPERFASGGKTSMRVTIRQRESPGSFLLRKSISEATSSNQGLVRTNRLTQPVRAAGQSVKNRLGATAQTKATVSTVKTRLNANTAGTRIRLQGARPGNRTVLCGSGSARNTVFARLGN
uniref:DUF5577 domain-containing protein n=1 Tax=Ornithodoros turicata TaxID=34597 RepID=A0A2R5LCY0_9ACAR